MSESSGMQTTRNLVCRIVIIDSEFSLSFTATYIRFEVCRGRAARVRRSALDINRGDGDGGRGEEKMY